MASYWTTSGINKIKGYILHDTYREDWEPQLVNSSVDIWVQWNDRYPFLCDMLGTHFSGRAEPPPGITTTCCTGAIPAFLQATIYDLSGGGVMASVTLKYESTNGRWEYTPATDGSGPIGTATIFWVRCGLGTWSVGSDGPNVTFSATVVSTCPSTTEAFDLVFSAADLTAIGGSANQGIVVGPGGPSSPTSTNTTNPVKIVRNNPQRHPFYNNLFCVGCRIRENKGQPDVDLTANSFIKYTSVNPTNPDRLQQTAGPVYTCTFAAMPYEVKPDSDAAGAEGELVRYVVRTPKLVGEQVQSNGLFEFTNRADGGVADRGQGFPVQTPPAVPCPYLQIAYKWMLVPDPIFNVITTASSMFASVNRKFFDVNYGNYEPGTLLFLGAEYERIPITPGLNIVWNITFNMAYRPQGWNVAYRPNRVWSATGPGWNAIRNRSTGEPPYASADFYQLFKV